MVNRGEMSIWALHLSSILHQVNANDSQEGPKAQDDPWVVSAHSHILCPGGGSKADGQDEGGYQQQRAHKPQRDLLSPCKALCGIQQSQGAWHWRRERLHSTGRAVL